MVILEIKVSRAFSTTSENVVEHSTLTVCELADFIIVILLSLVLELLEWLQLLFLCLSGCHMEQPRDNIVLHRSWQVVGWASGKSESDNWTWKVPNFLRVLTIRRNIESYQIKSSETFLTTCSCKYLTHFQLKSSINIFGLLEQSNLGFIAFYKDTIRKDQSRRKKMLQL